MHVMLSIVTLAVIRAFSSIVSIRPPQNHFIFFIIFLNFLLTISLPHICIDTAYPHSTFITTYQRSSPHTKSFIILIKDHQHVF